MSELHDSGKRETFETGMVRDASEDKPRPGLITPYGAERLAMHYTRGAKKYADRNWEKGAPFSRTLESLERHVLAWKKGCRDEDHLAAIAWNAFALMHYEEMIALGQLPADLDDMPKYAVKAKEKPTYTVDCSAFHPVKKTVENKFAEAFEGLAHTASQDFPKSPGAKTFPDLPLFSARAKPGPATPAEVFEELFSEGAKPGDVVPDDDPPAGPATLNEMFRDLVGWFLTTEVDEEPDTPRVYVAGPMRGIVHFNRPAFDSARDALIAEGWDVISPVDMEIEEGGEEAIMQPGSNGWQSGDQTGFIRRDVEAILSCDAIAMLPGWEYSTGAAAEFFVARWAGLDILDASTGRPFEHSPDMIGLGFKVAEYLDSQED